MIDTTCRLCHGQTETLIHVLDITQLYINKVLFEPVFAMNPNRKEIQISKPELNRNEKMMLGTNRKSEFRFESLTYMYVFLCYWRVI